MIILNLHGFLGKADNRTYTALSGITAKEHIISPHIDYMRDKPADILRVLSEIAEHTPELIAVGQSLGRYFAYHLARKHQIPCILTNPCLFPEQCGVIVHSGISNEILSGYHGIAEPYEKAWILCSTHDTVIPDNADICRQITPHMQIVSGTHSKIPDLSKYLDSILNEIECE